MCSSCYCPCRKIATYSYESNHGTFCRFFGWTKANEITNGRWVMFGFAVGLLTEYATGVDFPHQFALMASYLGLLDLD